MTGLEQIGASVGVTLLGAALGWIGNVLTQTRRDTRELLAMHKDPAKTGFGTEGMNDAILEQTKVLKDLAREISVLGHYVKELGGRLSPGVMPPPPPTGG